MSKYFFILVIRTTFDSYAPRKGPCPKLGGAEKGGAAKAGGVNQRYPRADFNRGAIKCFWEASENEDIIVYQICRKI